MGYMNTYIQHLFPTVRFQLRFARVKMLGSSERSEELWFAQNKNQQKTFHRGICGQKMRSQRREHSDIGSYA